MGIVHTLNTLRVMNQRNLNFSNIRVNSANPHMDQDDQVKTAQQNLFVSIDVKCRVSVCRKHNCIIPV